MKKKSPDSEGSELPLFDLPLRGPQPAKAPAPRPRRPAAEAAAPAVPVAAEEQLELGELDEIAEALPAFAGKATIGDRFFAGLADLMVHVVTLGLAALAVFFLGHPVTLREAPPLLVFGLLFSFLYSVFSLAFWGQTPGMAWAGHLARSVTGEPLTFGQTVLRWLGGILTLGLLGLPLLLALAGGRSLADRVSDSKTLQLG